MRYEPRVSIPSSSGQFTYTFGKLYRDPINSIYDESGITPTLYRIAWCSLLADSPFDPMKPNSVLFKFCKELESDLFGLIDRFNNLYHKLTLSVIYDEGLPLIREFLVEFKNTPIFREYLEFTKTFDPKLLQYISSFLCFGKKIHIVGDSSTESRAFRSWMSVEDRLESRTLPDLTSLSIVVDWLASSWHSGPFLPKHGPGAVSEPGILGFIAKNTSFSVSEKIYLIYDKIYPTIYGETEDFLPFSESPSTESIRHSRLKFVPKNWKTCRSICMEPICYQWAQQAVLLWFKDWLSKGVMNNHVDLNDQRHNQEASALGSLTLKVDTIDLSAASDSVGWDLVKEIFPSKILLHLAATRTSEVQLPDGTIRSVKKFAPMGSALCFPTQCTIFTAICLMVGMANALGRDWRDSRCFESVDLDVLYKYTFFNKTGNSYFPPRIYGDDIITDYRMTSSVMECLGELGFEVNESKSYVGNVPYRESCGEFHFMGFSVTPYFLKLSPLRCKVPIASVGSIIDAINRAHAFGYLHLRRHLIRFLLLCDIEGITAHGLNPIRFSSIEEDSFAIYTNTPINSHLLKRNWQESPIDSTANRFQVDEVRAIGIAPLVKRKGSWKHDPYLYTQWMHSRYPGGKERSHFEISSGAVDSMGNRVRWGWYPV